MGQCVAKSPHKRVNKRVNECSAYLGLCRRAETALGLDKADDALEAFAFSEIGHHERPFAAHPPCVDVHFLNPGADRRREVDLVDDEPVRPGDTWATLAGGLVAGCAREP